jgi:hypothetical protein
VNHTAKDASSRWNVVKIQIVHLLPFVAEKKASQSVKMSVLDTLADPTPTVFQPTTKPHAFVERVSMVTLPRKLWDASVDLSPAKLNRTVHPIRSVTAEFANQPVNLTSNAKMVKPASVDNVSTPVHWIALAV